MKTEIVFTEKPEQVSVCKDLEMVIKKTLFLVLKERGVLNQKQFEECVKKLKIEN